MRIVLLGPLGSGKDELAAKIAETYQLSLITQDKILDTVAEEPTELGKLAKEARNTSRVSDDLLIALLRMQLPGMDLSQGYVLVDMPRSESQTLVLEELLGDYHAPIDLVINLEVDSDDLMERLVGHIACDKCGTQYNLYVNPPMVEGICDVCGARVIKRPDDYEETISNRLRLYDMQMLPVLQRYQALDKLQRFSVKLDDTQALFDSVCGYIKSDAFQAHLANQAEENLAAEPVSEKIDTKNATQALEAAIQAMSPKRQKVSRKKATAKKTAKKKVTKKKVSKKRVAKK